MPTRTLTPPFPVDLERTLVPLTRGGPGPSLHLAADATVWRATRTASGTATVSFTPEGRAIKLQAWGDGAEEALATAPALLGCDDDDRSFRPRHPLLEQLSRTFPGLRLGATGAVFEALLPAVLEQDVTTFEAHRAHRQLVRDYGEPAPGPGGLMVPPAPEVLGNVASYELHIRGVEAARAKIVRRICSHGVRLERLAALPPDAFRAELHAVRGVSRSTAALTAQLALGDPDALALDDESLAPLVTGALDGEAVADTTRMLELLEPWRGQRVRVIRLLRAGEQRRHAGRSRPVAARG